MSLLRTCGQVATLLCLACPSPGRLVAQRVPRPVSELVDLLRSGVTEGRLRGQTTERFCVQGELTPAVRQQLSQAGASLEFIDFLAVNRCGLPIVTGFDVRPTEFRPYVDNGIAITYTMESSAPSQAMIQLLVDGQQVRSERVGGALRWDGRMQGGRLPDFGTHLLQLQTVEAGGRPILGPRRSYGISYDAPFGRDLVAVPPLYVHPEDSTYMRTGWSVAKKLLVWGGLVALFPVPMVLCPSSDCPSEGRNAGAVASMGLGLVMAGLGYKIKDRPRTVTVRLEENVRRNAAARAQAAETQQQANQTNERIRQSLVMRLSQLESRP